MPTAAIIALVSALVPVVNNLINFIASAQSSLKQGGEMTPEQEAALDQAIADLVVKPEEWQKVQAL